MKNVPKHGRPLDADAAKWIADLIVIGASTGGPKAVETVLESVSQLIPRIGSTSETCAVERSRTLPWLGQSALNTSAYVPVPIVIAQHMPEGFTRSFARRWNSACSFPVVEATDKTGLEINRAYVCPAGFLTRIQRKEDNSLVFTIEHASPEEWTYRPSVDVLFESAAQCELRVLAVVLTGMGSDGLLGAKAVKDSDGKVITESDQSAVIYGMPKAVYQAGLSDRHAVIQHIGAAIAGWL